MFLAPPDRRSFSEGGSGSHPSRPLAVHFRPVAAEAERVVAIRADFTAVAESRRVLAAAETDVTACRAEALAKAESTKTARGGGRHRHLS